MSHMIDLGRRRRTMRWLTGICLVLSLGLMADFAADIAGLGIMLVSDYANPGDAEPLTDCDPDEDDALLAPTTMGSPLALTFAMAAPRPVSLPQRQPPPVQPPKTQPTI